MNRTLRLAALTLTVLAGTTEAAHAGEQDIVLIDGPGRDLIGVHCVLCHSADYLTMNAPVMTRARWEATVRKMVEKLGAPIPANDAAAIVEYLSRHYSSDSPR